jgi:hypothetical protein
MKQEGINVGSVLVWGGDRSLEQDPVHFRGQEDDPVSEPDHILHWDIEISELPGVWNGHMYLLNVAQLDAVVPNQVNYPGQDYLFPNYQYVQSEGGIVGYAHGQIWPPGRYTAPLPDWRGYPRELPMDVALTRVDFLAAEIMTDGLYWLWYSMLDAGFHLPVLGDSDIGCYWPTVGRYHAAFTLPAGETLSYSKFIDAVRDGRTVIRRNASPPDFLDIRVNGVGLGGELILPNQATTVDVEVDASSEISGQRVELIVNGEVIESQSLTNEVQTYQWSVSLDKSGWIAAKTTGPEQYPPAPGYSQRPNSDGAHTSATFVLIGGCPIRNDPVSARNWKGYLESYYNKGIFLGEFGVSAPEVRQKIDEALLVWERIAQEGEGSVAMDCNAGIPDFTINAGLNGNWWNGLDRNGEGAQIEVAAGSDGTPVFVATMYSYDTMGKQIFLIAVGPVNGNSADVEVFITEGGMWGDDFNPALVNETQWGTGTFSADDCSTIHMALMPNAEFQALGYTDLAYDLMRLTTPAIPCPITGSE